jgi:hypothetical protein
MGIRLALAAVIPILVYATPVYAPTTLCLNYSVSVLFQTPEQIDEDWNRMRLAGIANQDPYWLERAHVTDINAYARPNMQTCHCTKHLPIQTDIHNPPDRYLQTVGHEDWHCIHGRWHP